MARKGGDFSLLPTDTTLLFPVMCFSAAGGCSLYLYWILSVVRPLWCGENSKKWVNLCREKMRKCGEMRIGQEGGGQAWPSPNLHYSLYYNYNWGNTIGTIVRTVGRGIWRFIQGRGSVVLCWLLLILLFWSGLKAGIITKTETEYHWMPGSSLAPLTMDQLSWNTAKWCCFHPSHSPHPGLEHHHRLFSVSCQENVFMIIIVCI